MKVFIILFSVLLFSGLYAGETEGKFALGVKIGMETYWGDIDDQQYKGLLGGSVFYWINNDWAIGLNAERGYLRRTIHRQDKQGTISRQNCIITI